MPGSLDVDLPTWQWYPSFCWWFRKSAGHHLRLEPSTAWGMVIPPLVLKLSNEYRTPNMATSKWYHSIYDIHMTQLPSFEQLPSLKPTALSWESLVQMSFGTRSPGRYELLVSGSWVIHIQTWCEQNTFDWVALIRSQESAEFEVTTQGVL